MDQTFEKSVTCPILVGRANQLMALRKHLSFAASGKGQMVLLSGEAGMGKSRLVKEAADYALQNGFAILIGHSYETEQSFPYAPLIDAFSSFLIPNAQTSYSEEIRLAARQFLQDLPELTDRMAESTATDEPEQRKRRLFYDLAQLIRRLCFHQPVFLIIEDLHWADENTLEFLLHLLQQNEAYACAVLLSYRTDETPSSLVHFLAEIDRRRMMNEIKIPPLSLNEVDALMQAIFTSSHPIHTAFLQTVYDLTEGNPFFIEETLKLLIASGEIFFDGTVWDRKSLEDLHTPRSVQDAVQQRFGRLSQPARQMLAACSVAGERFDFDMLKRITQTENPVDDRTLIQWMKEAIHAQLILEVGDGLFAFRHALTRQAINQGLLSVERLHLHQVIVNVLEERLQHSAEGSKNVRLITELAYHAYQAGDWRKAITYAEQSGALSQQMIAPRDAARFYTFAINASAKLSAPPRLDWLRNRGRCNEVLGDFASATEDYEKAYALANQTQDRFSQWEILLDLGLLWAAKDYERTGQYFKRALELAQQMDDALLLARSLNRLGNWRLNTGDLYNAAQAHQEALRLFQAQKDIAGAAETLDLLGLVYSMGGDMRQAEAHWMQGKQIIRQTDDKRVLLSCLTSPNIDLFHSVSVYYPPRPFRACQKDAAEALELAVQMDWTAGQALAEWTTGGMYAMFGQFGQALAYTRKGLETATRIDHRQWMTAAYTTLGRIELLLLQNRQAITALETGYHLAQELGSEYWVGEITTLLVLAHLANQNVHAAAQIFHGLVPDPQAWETQPLHTLGKRDLGWAWGEVQLQAGKPAEALTTAERLLAGAYGAFEPPINSTIEEPDVPVLLKLKGESLCALKRWDAAERVFQKAISAAIDRPDRPLVWQIQRAQGQCYLRQRKGQLAEDSFDAARAEVHALAETIDDPALRAVFVRSALETLPAERADPRKAQRKETYGGLTKRERQVAVLVAQGKTNREIAGALVLSERTVENHIARITSRLGFNSRAQIAAWAVKVGLDTSERDES